MRSIRRTLCVYHLPYQRGTRQKKRQFARRYRALPKTESRGLYFDSSRTLSGKKLHDESATHCLNPSPHVPLLIDAIIVACSNEHVRTNRLSRALTNLGEAVKETEAALEEVRSESDPLAAHIFISRRQFRNVPDTKGGKRSDAVARTSWQTACELGYRGSLAEWERLMGSVLKR